MTEKQKSQIKLQRGLFSKIFKYLEFKGILYEYPFSATMEGWDAWRDKVKKEYPIQYFIRTKIEDIENSLSRRFYSLSYYIRTLFYPENKCIRDSIPVRGYDVASIIEKMNFAAILQFKEEADKSWIDWDATEEHNEFKTWLDTAVIWITEGRAKLEKELEAAYPSYPIRVLAASRPVSLSDYQAMYKEVHRLEDLIEQTDENILIQMMKYRKIFWT